MRSTVASRIPQDKSMSFTINQTGIERGGTKLVLATAPIIVDRHAEESADSVYAVAITGAPITVQYVRSQNKTFLYLHIRLVSGADVDTLNTLMGGIGAVNVKLTPGDATVILCMFGPRDDQDVVPYNGDYATGKSDGSPVDPILTQHYADLFLLRL